MQIGIAVPYFSTAATAAKGTTLIAVLPRRYTDAELRIAEAPLEIAAFRYPMLWHPRVTGDPMHQWVGSIVAVAGAELSRAWSRAGSDRPPGDRVAGQERR